MAKDPPSENTDEDWVVSRDARVKTLEEENKQLRKQLGLIESYSTASESPPKWISKFPKKQGTALAVGQLSDTHFEEVVLPDEMNGLNSYNRDIAVFRLKRWANKVCEMLWLHREEFKWQGFLGLISGDIFSGNIHRELIRTNQNHIPESIAFWVPQVAAALGQVVDEIGAAYFDCVVGNHGRLSEKPEYKGRARNNYDFLFYELVKSHFKNDNRIQWNLSVAPYSFAPLPSGEWICHSHGDEEKMGSNKGTAGVMNPLGRIRVNAIKHGQTHNRKVAYSVCGHWHQSVQAQSWGAVVNGTMKGYDEFALGHSFEYGPPTQNFWVETSDKGTVLSRSLLVSSQKEEGW